MIKKAEIRPLSEVPINGIFLASKDGRDNFTYFKKISDNDSYVIIEHIKDEKTVYDYVCDAYSATITVKKATNCYFVISYMDVIYLWEEELEINEE
jgi:hypothetical protein